MLSPCSQRKPSPPSFVFLLETLGKWRPHLSARHICPLQNRCQFSRFLQEKWHSAAWSGSPLSSAYRWGSSEDMLRSVRWWPQLLTAAENCSDLLCTISLPLTLKLPSSHSLYSPLAQLQDTHGEPTSPCQDKIIKISFRGENWWGTPCSFSWEVGFPPFQM